MAYTAIDDSEAYFQTVLYTGNGGTQSITFDGTTDMQPDLIWNKARSATEEHNMWDPVRGAYNGIMPSLSSGESTWGTGVSSFNSDGWTMGGLDSCNANTEPFAAWCWKESATSGFDIVSYTGNGSARTISHSLSAVPKLILVKNRDESDEWRVYHGANTAAPETDFLVFNDTDATADAADVWNDTAPTSSVFSLGDADEVNTNTEDYIAYLFAEKQGFSKFGTYEGSADADGPFVYTGFKPAFVICKADELSDWEMFDNKRLGYNVDNNRLAVNDKIVESTTDRIDLLSNGFKFRITTDPNAAKTWLYMAFAEAPLVNSNGVPGTAR